MRSPAPYDAKRTPVIEWAGDQWPIPPLVADQLDLVWDDIIALSTALFAQIEGDEGSADISEEANLRRGYMVVGRRLELTSEQYKKLREVVYCGLTRAHPDLTMDEFRAVPSKSLEMLNAFFVVRRQSGIFGDFEGGDEVPASAGEAEAA